MRYVKWIVFSLVLHVGLISFMGAWEKISMDSDESEILDLTYYQAGSENPGSPQQAPKKAPSVVAAPKTSASTPHSESANPTVGKTESTTSTNPSDSSSGNGDEGGSGTGEVAWGEITEFPTVLGEVKANYPEEAKKAGISGAVVLELVIGKEGQLQTVKVISGPGYGLEESATEAIKKFRFKPAKKGKESVAVRIQYTYRFKLDIN